jgi:Reverse transcriptase (RNA-dependent DNA polymerase)/Endonuclease/Exonuclease/phosphatase family
MPNIGNDDVCYSPYSDLNIQCNYMDVNQYIASKNNCDKFSFCSLNIQSVHAKFSALEDLCNNFENAACAPDLILLQETWQIQSVDMLKLNNYNELEFKCRCNNVQGGGVGIYFRKGLRYKILHEKSIFIDRILESMFVEVWISPIKKIIVGNVYRPSVNHPTLTSSEQFAQFFELFTNILDEFSDQKVPVYIFGDLNLDVLKYNIVRQVTEYIDLLFSFGYLQLIMKPTRCTPSSASIIDHFITNHRFDVYESIILTSRISDHFPFIAFIDSPKNIPRVQPQQKRIFSDQNFLKFNEAFRAINWEFLGTFDCVNEQYNHFSETFNTLYDLYFPLTPFKVNKNFQSINPWMSKGLLISRRQKNLLCSISVKKPYEPYLSNYKKYRNLYFRILRVSKQLFFQTQLKKFQTDSKKTWETLRKIVNNKRHSENSINNIVTEGQSFSDPEIIANKFNVFFTNVASSIVDSMHPSLNNPNLNFFEAMEDANSDPLQFKSNPVTHSEIVEAIQLLNDKLSQDENGISSHFVKRIALTIAKPLLFIFSNSFNTGSIPSSLKNSKIIPLLKSGDRACMDNYRPIAMLNVFSKILEKIVSNRLCIFLDSNNILSKFQFGFRKGHSTLHPMILFMNKITQALENREHVIAIFCDLKKAFDCCNHDLLLQKLKNIGIKGIALKWFFNYLKGRMQYVNVNGAKSALLDIKNGVPQGSILGPILFLIYINDLPNCSEFLSLLFADDTTLLLSHSDLDTLIVMVNLEFRKVVHFFRINKLALHPSKTKFMLFSNSPTAKNTHIEIFMNFNNENENLREHLFPLERVSANSDIPAIRFLGVYFDENLNFKHHISLLTSKLSKALYIMRSAKNFITPCAMKSVYYALFHCNLIYCIQIWSCTAISNLKHILTLQKKAIRLTSNANYNAHSEPLFKSLEILPFNYLTSFFNLQVMQHYNQGFLPEVFDNVWLTNATRCRQDFMMALRNRENFNIPYARLQASMNQPLINLPRLWSQFVDEDIKIIRNKPEFNLKLKKYFLNKLSSAVRCNRLLCPACHL